MLFYLSKVLFSALLDVIPLSQKPPLTSTAASTATSIKSINIIHPNKSNNVIRPNIKNQCPIHTSVPAYLYTPVLSINKV
jgi:hypothetical protein